jgi:hypothetical protein
MKPVQNRNQPLFKEFLWFDNRMKTKVNLTLSSNQKLANTKKGKENQTFNKNQSH